MTTPVSHEAHTSSLITHICLTRSRCRTELSSCEMSLTCSNLSILRTSRLQVNEVTWQRRQHVVRRSVLCFNKYDILRLTVPSAESLVCQEHHDVFAEPKGVRLRQLCRVLQGDRLVCNLAQPVRHNHRQRCRQAMSKALCSSLPWQTKTGYVSPTVEGIVQDSTVLWLP